MHLVFLMTEHQLQMQILVAYLLDAELFQLDRLRCGVTD